MIEIDNSLEELRKRLMSYEPSDAELGEHYRKEIDAMLHRGRGRVRRWRGMMAGMVFIFAALFGVLGVPLLARTPVPPFAGWMIISGACYMGMIGIVTLVCGIRDIDPRRYASAWTGIGALFTALLAAGLLNESWQTQDATLRWQLTEVAFIVLGVIGVSTFIHFIEHYHKRADLRLLQLEYRLADMAAHLRKDAAG